MKKCSFLIVAFLLIFAGSSALCLGVEVHPRNRVIAETDPRPYKMRFPEVPRITAEQAYDKFLRGEAFFVHVGEAGGNVPGGLHLSEAKVQAVNVQNLLDMFEGKQIILYCH